LYLVLKALVSGAIIAAASELARRSSLAAAILISLPLTSILAMVWLYRDSGDPDEIAELSWSILWVIVPSLSFFVALPLAIKGGVSFWPALLVASVVTAAAYAVWVGVASALGLDL